MPQTISSNCIKSVNIKQSFSTNNRITTASKNTKSDNETNKLVCIFDTRVDGCQKCTRVHGPSTRVVETGLYWSITLLIHHHHHHHLHSLPVFLSCTKCFICVTSDAMFASKKCRCCSDLLNVGSAQGSPHVTYTNSSLVRVARLKCSTPFLSKSRRAENGRSSTAVHWSRNYTQHQTVPRKTLVLVFRNFFCGSVY